MNSRYPIEIAKDQHRELIISLLQSAKLPVEDLPNSLVNFLVSMDGGQVIGVIGLEQYESSGLLRSLVVNKDYRNNNIASALVDALEEKAAGMGINFMYLLTETAPDYFEKRGYEKIEREELPTPVKSSSEFSFVCPVGAIVMKKSMV